MSAIIDVSGVCKSFGGVVANDDVSLSVKSGSITGLIGPNGSGKTTLFNSIVGYHPIDAGSIKFENREISALSVQQIARRGLLRVERVQTGVRIEKRMLKSGDLSFGQQKLLEFAMALMNEPTCLLLDEPTAGINPTLINGLIDRLKRANSEFGITLFVIEHNMRVIMNMAEKIYCLAHGKMLAEGTPDEIQNDQRVIDAYLGAH